jgi:hypothetical protein
MLFKKLLTPCYRASIRNLHMNNQLLKVEQNDGIKFITMIDNKTRNCLSLQMMDNLINEIEKDKDEKSLRAIVLSASGSVFSAGHNLKELSPDKEYKSHYEVFNKCHELIRSLMESPLPIIAKVDGLAAGNVLINFNLHLTSSRNIISFIIKLLDYNLRLLVTSQYVVIKVISQRQEHLLEFSVQHLELQFHVSFQE